MQLKTGQIVKVRSRQYLVEEVAPKFSEATDTLLMPRVGLFIADVGLGKTIEAGLNFTGNADPSESAAGGDCLSSLSGTTMARGNGKSLWVEFYHLRSRIFGYLSARSRLWDQPLDNSHPFYYFPCFTEG